MKSPRLSIETINYLRQVHKTIPDKRLAYRINAIILLGRGMPFSEVSDNLLLSDSHVRALWDTYESEGVDPLLETDYKGRIPRLSVEQQEKLCDELNSKLFSTAKSICNWVENEFDITYTPEGMVILLHRLGYSYKKTKLLSAKVNLEKQKEFIEEYMDLRENADDAEIVYFIDGVHPTHNVSPGSAWVLKGEERVVNCNTGRKRVNINGAYSPESQEVIFVECDKVNSQSTIELYKKLEAANPSKETIYVVRDNARYYCSALVKEYLETSKIVELPLPTYSPNLNLIERLWKFVKKKITSNRYLSTFEEFKSAIRNLLENILEHKEELDSLMVEKFHIHQSV